MTDLGAVAKIVSGMASRICLMLETGLIRWVFGGLTRLG